VTVRSSRRLRGVLGGALLAATACTGERTDVPAIVVGSKSFTESYILGEMIAQVIDEAGEARAERRLGLGGTGIVYGALASGAIDVYPEYTGTIAQAILGQPGVTTVEALRGRLAARGLTLSAPSDSTIPTRSRFAATSRAGWACGPSATSAGTRAWRRRSTPAFWSGRMAGRGSGDTIASSSPTCGSWSTR
jgi:hypothetical protein